MKSLNISVFGICPIAINMPETSTFVISFSLFMISNPVSLLSAISLYGLLFKINSTLSFDFKISIAF